MIPKREHARNSEQTYFVTSSTWERRPLFRAQPFAELLVAVLRQYRGSSYRLHEFVLMPDRFHLLVTPHGTAEAVPFQSVDRREARISGKRR
jgi:REP element-mobilizing transposase RayT